MFYNNFYYGISVKLDLIVDSFVSDISVFNSLYRDYSKFNINHLFFNANFAFGLYYGFGCNNYFKNYNPSLLKSFSIDI